MRNAFNKEVRRSITQSAGRFLAIAVIAALGCGFFAGLRMTSIDMDLSADRFYDDTNLSDLYVTSSLGLDEENIEQIASVQGVKAVSGVKLVDSYALVGDAKYVVRFNSIDMDAARASDSTDGQRTLSSDDAYINRPILVEGAWPDAPGECVIAADAVLDTPVEIGDIVQAIDSESSDQDALVTKEYVVTGFVRSPYYLMTSNFGSSTLGSGEIETYVFVPEGDFSEEYPLSGAFVTVDGAMDERYPSTSYDEIVDAVVMRIEGISDEIRVQRLDSVKAKAQEELDDARAEYDAEYASAMTQLDSAQGKLDSARSQLDDSSRKLSENSKLLDESKEQIEAGEAQLADGKALIDEKQAEIDAGMRQIEAQEKQLSDEERAANAQFVAWQQQIDSMPYGPDRDKAQSDLEAARAEALGKIAYAREQLADKCAEIAQGQRELDERKRQLQEREGELAAGKLAYEEGSAKLADGYAQYNNGLSEYRSGLEEYESKRATALQKLADGKAKLDDAQAEIDDIELPELYILDRSKNVGVAGHEADASRIDQIAQVFPLIFFLVAALVVLTTMTRMVDEERMLIGTYKALGYSNARIISKYLIYAFITSGIGSIIGILVLSQFLPQFIMQAYSIIYALPVSISPLDFPIALLAFCLSVGITLVVTWFAVYSSLREKPALLMLPRAPKPGKRILLERLRPLWRHMSFSSKVTARNLFRYKQRFLMAVIGIAGCTALLLTGLGLYDGINDIIEKQFGELEHFNLEIQMSDEQDPQDTQRVEEILEDSSIVTETTRLARESVLVTAVGSSEDLRASIYVPEDLDAFDDFFTLRERVSQEPLALDGNGAIVTEKLSSELGVRVGDSIDVFEQSTIGERSGVAHQVRVAGITEFYTGQRIFMTPAYYEAVMGEPSVATELICKAEAPYEQRNELANQILDVAGVEVVSYYDEVIETYKTMLQTVNAVVWVLIISAALLAFVVIYNLTNINITERTREIATLKVLGFTARETNAYIFRETLILTIIGALVGLVLGIWMESFVVVTAEVNEMMFGRDVHMTSFVIAFVMTIAFSIIVSLAMMPKIKSIDMVQSLKSVD